LSAVPGRLTGGRKALVAANKSSHSGDIIWLRTRPEAPDLLQAAVLGCSRVFKQCSVQPSAIFAEPLSFFQAPLCSDAIQAKNEARAAALFRS
jgi:hypothetical protein